MSLEEKREKEALAIKKKLKRMIYWGINCYQGVELILLKGIICLSSLVAKKIGA